MTEDYNKIIESLGVKFAKARHIKMLQAITIKSFYDVENTLMVLYDGHVKLTGNEDGVQPGDLLFIPGGKHASITYGTGTPKVVTNEELMTKRDLYFESLSTVDNIGSVPNSFGLIAFDAKIFDSVNFFNSLDIPPFFIKQHALLADLMKRAIAEDFENHPGRGRVLANLTELIVVEVVRHILKQGMFVEQLATNSTYFKDPRLIDIFAYIKDNLNGDLSNKQLANVANVSEDYVGQYFKMLTGINPQDYIEYQRMESAVTLLRTSKKSIRAIGAEVGYKDTAYFCRRFKMMFGIPAGKMRRRESLITI